MSTEATAPVKVERSAFGIVYFGVILLLVGIVMTLTPIATTGLLVGATGISMLTVGMLRRYR